MSFGSEDKHAVVAAEKAGIIVDPQGDERITIQDCSAVWSTQPSYCFCLSTVPDSPSLLAPKPQAIFEIKHTFGLAKRLREKHPDNFKLVNFGVVQYKGRVRLDYENADGVQPWLLKEQCHSRDAEFRILIYPPKGVTPQPFITPEDADIAAFFRRIA